MMNQVLHVCLLFCALCDVTRCARILCALPTPIKSHMFMFDPLITELARRGHELTVIGSFPRKIPTSNIRDIDVSSVTGIIVESSNVQEKGEKANGFRLPLVANLFLKNIKKNSKIYELPEVDELLKSDKTFDLILLELFDSEVSLALMHKFKAPSIALSSCPSLPWASSRFADPDNPSYVPVMFTDHVARMSFMQRLMNFVYSLSLQMISHFLLMPESQFYARKYFGEDLPDMSELAKNTSLLLVNTHHSLTGIKPYVPAVIEVGGIHVGQPQKLPQVGSLS